MISTNFVLSLIGALSVGSLVAAHGDASHGAQLIAYRRHYHLAHRALEAKCGSKIRARQLKRALAKRSHEPRLAQALMKYVFILGPVVSEACHSEKADEPTCFVLPPATFPPVLPKTLRRVF